LARADFHCSQAVGIPPLDEDTLVVTEDEVSATLIDPPPLPVFTIDDDVDAPPPPEAAELPPTSPPLHAATESPRAAVARETRVIARL